MKYTVIDKETKAPQPRTGEAAELYKDLAVLLQNAPEKKLLVDFGTIQAGYRAVQRMIPWATEDGFLVYQTAVKGSAKRELYLERQTDAEEVSA